MPAKRQPVQNCFTTVAPVSNVIPLPVVRKPNVVPLKDRTWCVHTESSNTIQLLHELCKECGLEMPKSKEIYYGARPYNVYPLPFTIVKELHVRKKNGEEIDFTGLYKEKTITPWAVWKEGSSSPQGLLGIACQRIAVK
jgi:hypothetical protein